MKRKLTSRHLNMIAIGGAIGTGLFIASGGTISQAGTAGALVAYLAIGMMVFLNAITWRNVNLVLIFRCF